VGKQIKQNVMDGSRGTHGKEVNCLQVFGRKPSRMEAT